MTEEEIAEVKRPLEEKIHQLQMACRGALGLSCGALTCGLSEKAIGVMSRCPIHRNLEEAIKETENGYES